MKSIKSSDALMVALYGLALISAALVASPLAAQRSQNGNAQATQATTAETQHEGLRLQVGEQKVLDSEGVRSFSEGVKGVVDVRLTKDNDSS